MKYLSRCNPAWLLASGLLCGCGLIGYDNLTPEPAPAATETDPASPRSGGLQSGGGVRPAGGGGASVDTGGTSGPAELITGGTDRQPPAPSTGGAVLPTGGGDTPAMSGGAASSGGSGASGGEAVPGGSPASGGVDEASGGAQASGGSAGSGGTIGSGGMPGTGGAETGGSTTSGGSPGAGGSASGGAATSGGGASSGGTAVSGAMQTGGQASDAGVPELDAGPPPTDAGTPPPWDGGGPLDSGTTPLGGVSLQNAPLLHRYDFSGVGSVALDLVGDADGLLLGGSTLNGTGQALLDGAGGYVSLPSGMISRLGSASFVAWVDFRGGDCGQHIFDFGSSTGGPGAAGEGISSLYAEMSGCGLFGRPWARYYEDGASRSSVFSWATIPQGVHMITVIVDRTLPLASWYIDDFPVLVFPVPFALTDIVDENVWLGRSQWSDDPMLNANYDEFRIYGAALSLGAIQELYSGGPNYLP